MLSDCPPSFPSLPSAGEGRVHKCLRENRKELSEACRKEELLLEEKEATSIELNQGLVKTCKAERQLFCSEVQPGSARVFR
jgi:Golgi apparatus protein 1